MLITISGQSGSGKSSAAQLLSEVLKIPTIDTGAIFRRMAKERGMDVIDFGTYMERHPELDRELDRQVMAAARKSKKGAILQGRLAGWMAAQEPVPSAKIWIAAKASTRAKRTCAREGIPYAKALKNIAVRDGDNVARYKKTYGLDLNDLSVYDAVVESDNRSLPQVVREITKKLKLVWQKTTQPRRVRPRKPQRTPKRPSSRRSSPPRRSSRA